LIDKNYWINVDGAILSWDLLHFYFWNQNIEHNEKDMDRFLFSSSKVKKEEKTMKQAVYTKSLTIAVSPEQYAQIKGITDEKRISMGEWVREALEAALSKLQQKEDIM